MSRATEPTLAIANRQRSVAYDHIRAEALARAALPLCLDVARRLGGPLESLRSVEVSVVGARAMARIHREFLGAPGATDVITFPYGEILVCASVAAARAEEFRHSVTEEIALYVTHGLLHLAGLDDILPAAAARMAREQEKILRRVSDTGTQTSG